MDSNSSGNLKHQTISGLTWSFIDGFSNLGTQFIIGIILARLLSPKEFGLIGMIIIFITISQFFIDSGFSNSLIRKKDCTQSDYSTVFYFNLIVGIVFYILLFFLARPISVFFNETKLINIIRVSGISLIISSISIIQKTILIKRIDFKLQTKISIISAVFSGIVAIYMAYFGFGVWSLVWRTIIFDCLTTILLWLWNRWYPLMIFNYNLFKEHLKFGSKLLLSGLINTLYRNIYYLIIGKFFSAAELGYYTKAEEFKNLPSSNITSVITRVSYPILSQLQDEPKKLKEGFKKLIISTMFISFILMIGMAAIAKPLILTLIGVKWSSSIIYLQLMCFSAMLYPLHALNLNILNVKGRSDLFLRLEIIKTFLAIPVILSAIFWGVKTMLVVSIITSFITLFLNSFWSKKLIDYSIKEQIIDIVPSFLLAMFMGIIVTGLGYLLPFNSVYLLITQISLGAIIIISISKFFNLAGYMEIREIILNRLLFLNKIFNAK